MPNVLIFTPTWFADGNFALHPECEDSIHAQRDTFDGKADWCIGTENPYPIGQHRNVLHQYQRAQQHFLADSTYDALLTVEHDNVLTRPDTLQLMYDTVLPDGKLADVVYAPYQLRHGAFVLNTWQYINDFNLGMPLNNYPEELARYKAAGVGRICGCGMGCTLFRRHTLERLQFRGGNGEQWAPDIPFAEDALRAHFVSMGRFDCPVDHWDGNVKLEAYATVEKMPFMAVETVNAMAAGEYVSLVAGQVYELTAAVASDLSRVGYIRSLPAVAPGPETASLQPGAEQSVMPKARRRRA